MVPVTTNVDRVYPFQLLLPAEATGSARDSKAQAEEIRSVAIERVGQSCGSFPAALPQQLDRALRLHLAL